jgi:hypothetical protein
MAKQKDGRNLVSFRSCRMNSELATFITVYMNKVSPHLIKLTFL